MYMILGMILGGAIVTLIYENYNDKNEAKVRILLAPKIKAKTKVKLNTKYLEILLPPFKIREKVLFILKYPHYQHYLT